MLFIHCLSLCSDDDDDADTDDVTIFSPTYSPVRLPRASAPTILPRPTSPAQPPPVPEVRITSLTKLHAAGLYLIFQSRVTHIEAADRGPAGQKKLSNLFCDTMFSHTAAASFLMRFDDSLGYKHRDLDGT